MSRMRLYYRIVLAALLLSFAVEQAAAQFSRITPRRASMSYRLVTGTAAATEDHAGLRRQFRTGDRQDLPGEHALSGHRIEIGEGMALTYRKHISFTEFGIEDENAIFEKLTVFLPAPPEGDYGVIDLSERPEIIVFWSRGAARFSAEEVCAGYAESGEIEFRRVRGELQAKFDFRIRPIGAEQYDGRACKPFRFLHDSWFNRSSARFLSPWEGGGSGEISDDECNPGR